jgi:hypothetical protein
MQKISEISLISLVLIKIKAYLYPILPFEFGIAGFSVSQGARLITMIKSIYVG